MPAALLSPPLVTMSSIVATNKKIQALDYDKIRADQNISF